MSIQQHGDIIALREHLFASIKRLSADKPDPKEIERAKAIADTAQVIVNTAKVEVDFLRATGGKGSGFIPLAAPDKPGAQIVEQRPGVRVTRHRLEG